MLEFIMKMRHHLLVLSCIAALTLAAQPVLAGNDGSASGSANAGSTVSTQLASRYANFAGSQDNATSLITGLRSGTPFTLISTDTTGTTAQTTITPATGSLGYGEVNTALALAQAELTKYGITDPTPQQIETALDGGTLTTSTGGVVTLSGVLSMRQSGEGWGQIANSLGYRLGNLVSASETSHGQAGMHAGASAGMGISNDQTGVTASANAAANASLHANLPARVDLPQRPNIPAVVRPNLPIHPGPGGG
jgi:hypothetical protein